MKEAEYNQAVDHLARVRATTPAQGQDDELLIMAQWVHEKSGHLGEQGTREWALQQGIPCSTDAVHTVIASCKVCARVKGNPLIKTPWATFTGGRGQDKSGR